MIYIVKMIYALLQRQSNDNSGILINIQCRWMAKNLQNEILKMNGADAFDCESCNSSLFPHFQWLFTHTHTYSIRVIYGLSLLL